MTRVRRTQIGSCCHRIYPAVCWLRMRLGFWVKSVFQFSFYSLSFRNAWRTLVTIWGNRPQHRTRKKKMWEQYTIWHFINTMLPLSWLYVYVCRMTKHAFCVLDLAFCPCSLMRPPQPFEVDLSHVYLAYTEESMRQSLMKLERPRTSKSSKSGRPKTGRRYPWHHAVSTYEDNIYPYVSRKLFDAFALFSKVCLYIIISVCGYSTKNGCSSLLSVGDNADCVLIS